MYSRITNPETGRNVTIESALGKHILRNYLLILSGGAIGSPPSYNLTKLEEDIPGLSSVIANQPFLTMEHALDLKKKLMEMSRILVSSDDSFKNWLVAEAGMRKAYLAQPGNVLERLHGKLANQAMELVRKYLETNYLDRKDHLGNPQRKSIPIQIYSIGFVAFTKLLPQTFVAELLPQNNYIKNQLEKSINNETLHTSAAGFDM